MAETVKRLKPPPLEGSHGLLETTRQEWRRWWRDGYASAGRWGKPTVQEARELLTLIDLNARTESVEAKVALSKSIREGRRALGLFGPAPLPEEDAELRRPGRADRQKQEAA